MEKTAAALGALLVAIALSACGEPPAPVRATARATLGRPAPAEVLAEPEAPAPRVAEAEPAAATEPTATVAAATSEAPAAEPREVDGLSLRRLVVAHGVENREPVGAETTFRASSEPVVAFVELRNASAEARRVHVRFRSEDGRTLGPVTLDVPANAPRWRTWARSSWLRRPGAWTVLVSTPEGELLDSARFDVEL